MKSQVSASQAPNTALNELVDYWHTDERFHDSKYPTWKFLRGPIARQRRADRIVAALSNEVDPRLNNIAFQIAACRKGRRCGKVLCPHCAVATNRGFVALALANFSPDDIALVTIIPSDERLQPMSFDDLDLAVQKDALYAAIDDASLQDLPLLAGIDVLWYDCDIADNEYCAAHFHGIIPKRLRHEVHRRLSAFYAKTARVRAPVLAKPVTHIALRAIAYCYKPDIYVTDTTCEQRHSDSPARVLSPDHKCFRSMALACDTMRFSDRTYFNNICTHMRNSSNSTRPEAVPG